LAGPAVRLRPVRQRLSGKSPPGGAAAGAAEAVRRKLARRDCGRGYGRSYPAKACPAGRRRPGVRQRLSGKSLPGGAAAARQKKTAPRPQRGSVAPRC